MTVSRLSFIFITFIIRTNEIIGMIVDIVLSKRNWYYFFNQRAICLWSWLTMVISLKRKEKFNIIEDSKNSKDQFRPASITVGTFAT